jgi:hypothetical protein
MRRSQHVLFVAVVCGSVLALQSSVVSSRLDGRDFVVAGLSLGQAVNPESQSYKAYSCRSSHDFVGFTWCAYHSDRTGKSGSFKDWVTFLHSPSNRLVFITEDIAPAYFAPGDVDREIARISKGFDQTARLLTANASPGFPHAILATWGDVTLTPLNDSALDALRRGEEIHQGLIADFIGDARESARRRLPVFKLGGGPGFIWGASFDDTGKGTLRDSAVDVSELANTGEYAAASNVPANQHRRPILAEDAPILRIHNKSCREIETVLIDGATQLHGIAPGDVGVFHMATECSHNVEGMSGDLRWNSDIKCQGMPYQDYTLNWTYTNGPSSDSSISEDDVLVETRSTYSYGGELEITSKLDCIEIQKISVNRGNCNVGNSESESLKFGQTITIPYFCDRVLEINLSTDHGDGVFTFSR